VKSVHKDVGLNEDYINLVRQSIRSIQTSLYVSHSGKVGQSTGVYVLITVLLQTHKSMHKK